MRLELGNEAQQWMLEDRLYLSTIWFYFGREEGSTLSLITSLPFTVVYGFVWRFV